MNPIFCANGFPSSRLIPSTSIPERAKKDSLNNSSHNIPFMSIFSFCSMEMRFFIVCIFASLSFNVPSLKIIAISTSLGDIFPLAAEPYRTISKIVLSCISAFKHFLNSLSIFPQHLNRLFIHLFCIAVLIEWKVFIKNIIQFRISLFCDSKAARVR